MRSAGRLDGCVHPPENNSNWRDRDRINNPEQS
jgi:hypothetical protein